jgi:hypothetical protein
MIFLITSIVFLFLPAALSARSTVVAKSDLSINGIPFSTRAHWMRQANQALREVASSPCPFAAFGTVIVNHTSSDGLGDLICIGANQNDQTGNPALHGKTQSDTLELRTNYLFAVLCRRDGCNPKLHQHPD